MARKKIKRNVFKIKLDESGKFYIHKYGNYVREEINPDNGCKHYVYKSLDNGDKLLFCINKKKKGPKGGRTTLLAILRPINKDLRKYKGREQIKKVIKKARIIKRGK